MSRRRKRARQTAPPETEGYSGRHRRLLTLFGALLLAGIIFVATGGWRERLLQESARYRASIAEIEARSAAETEEARMGPDLARALQQNPGDERLRVALALVQARRAGPASAAAVLSAAPRPLQDPEAIRFLSQCYQQLQREDRALAVLQDGIRRLPRDGSLRADRASLYVLLGWRTLAAEEIRAAERLGAANLWRPAADLARAKTDFAAARAVLEAARRASPSDVEITRQLAAVAMDAERYADVIALVESIPVESRDVAEWMMLASAHFAQEATGTAGRALTIVEEVLRRYPGAARARLLRARIFLRSGREPEARAQLEELYRQFPRLPGLAFDLGELYRKSGRTQEAIRLLGEHREAGKQASTLTKAVAAIIRSPEDGRAHAELGRLLLRQRVHGRAIVELQRAAQLGHDGQVNVLLKDAIRAAETAR